MKRLSTILLVLLTAASMAIGAGRSRSCDRTCLKATLDQYLAAVLKHDALRVRNAGVGP